MTNHSFNTKFNFKATNLQSTFSIDAISEHYQKHYIGYVNNLQGIVKDSRYQNMSIDQILLHLDLDGNRVNGNPMYINASQIRNHDLFFQQLSEKNKNEITNQSLLALIKKNFISIKNLKQRMLDEGKQLFGSGWIWLILQSDTKTDKLTLKITSTPNSGTFITDSKKQQKCVPLIIIDMWEHSYYTDYKSNRDDYINKMWSIINWSVVEKRYVEHI